MYVIHYNYLCKRSVELRPKRGSLHPTLNQISGGALDNAEQLGQGPMHTFA